jgi:hypothetical protein
MNCTLIAHIAQRQQTVNPFGSTFPFFANTQAKQRNVKELPSNRTKTAVNIDRQATTERTPACNRRLAKVAVQCSADTFVVNQSLVLRINICGENRHLRQAPNRCAAAKKTTIILTIK